MKKILILIFILLQTGMYAQENELGQHIDSLLQFSASPSFNGVVLVTQNGKTMYKKSMGFADMDKKTPLTENIVQYGQTGFAPGYVSMNFYFPKSKTSLIILSNTAYQTSDFTQTFRYHMGIWRLVRESLLSVN